MANKSQIKNIPLTGPVNLNKNELNIISPGEEGFLHNDGVLYGDVLSPIYKKTESNAFDWYASDGKKYIQGTITLDDEDDHTVLQFEQKTFKQKQENKNIIAKGPTYEARKNGDIISIGHYVEDEWVAESFTFTSPVLASNLSDDVHLVLFTVESGIYKIYAYNRNDLSEPSVKSVVFTNVGKPFFSYYSGAYTLWSNNQNAEVYSFYLNSGAITDLEFVNNDQDETIQAAEPYQVAYMFAEVQKYTTVLSGTRYNVKQYSTWKHFNSLALPLNENFRIRVFWKPFNNGAFGDWGTMLSETLDTNDMKYLTGDYSNPLPWTRAIIKASQVTATPVTGCISGYSGYGPIYSISNDPNGLGYIEQRPLAYFQNPNSGIFDLRLTQTSNTEYTVSSGDNSVLLNDEVMYKCFTFDPNTPSQGDKSFTFELTTPNVSLVPYLSMENTTASSLGYLIVHIWDGNTGHVYKWIPENSKNAFQTLGLNGVLVTANGTVFNASDLGFTFDDDKVAIKWETPDAILSNGQVIYSKAPRLKTDDETYRRQRHLFSGGKGTLADIGGVQKVNWPLTGSTPTWMYAGAYDNGNYPFSLVNYQSVATPYFFKSTLTSKGAPTTKQINGERVDTTKENTVVYDNNKMYLFPGVDVNTNMNVSNTKSQVFGNWYALYNQNILSAISYQDTLLTDWDSVSDILYADNTSITFKDAFGNITTIYIADEKPSHQIVLDRYFVINTTSFFNCYDMVDKKPLHWASDWNGRAMLGHVLDNNYRSTNTFTYFLENLETIPVSIQASAINPNYQVTKDPISGYAGPAIKSKDLVKENWNLILPPPDGQIDFFFSSNETVAVYDMSYESGNFFIDGRQVGTDYLNEILYNPNIFTRFIKSYTQRSMVINESQKTAYPLNLFNGTIAISYRLVNGIENAENIFVIQTMVYSISNGFLYEVIYDNETISNYQAILPLNGLRFLGCTPISAFFWNQRTREVFTFNGDAIMRFYANFNEVSTICDTFYFPDSQELFISTDIGLISLSDSRMYIMEDYTHVSDMWFFNDYFVLKNEKEVTISNQGTSYTEIQIKDTYCSYEPKPGYEGILKYQTKWLGSKENFKSQFDTLYIRVFKNKANLSTDYIKVKSYTMTDIACESDANPLTHNFTADDFDNISDVAYIRLQPKYQKAIAMTFKVESTLPIVSMALGYNELDEVGALSRINI